MIGSPQIAGGFRRALAPASAAVLAWLATWVLSMAYLVSARSGRVTAVIGTPFSWSQVPAILLLPDLNWIVPPVLLVCVGWCAARGGGAAERATVAFAPLIALLLVSWVAVCTLPIDLLPGDLTKASDTRWCWLFVGRDGLSLAGAGAAALLLHSSVERAFARRSG